MTDWPRHPALLLLTLTLATLVGCSSHGSASAPTASNLRRESASASGMGGRPLSPTEKEVVANALREWHRTEARPGQVFELDRYDRRITPAFRSALRDICTPLPSDFDRSSPELITLTLEQVDLPQGNYAYAVLRAGNQFDTVEHAYVYFFLDDDWVLLDHYVVAEGLMNAALIEFSWAAYCQDKGIAVAE